MHSLQVLPNIKGRLPELDYYYVSILDRCKWNLLFGGERVLLYQRRWSGTRCPNYDQVRKQHVIDATVDSCYGTGWVGGYYRPTEIYVSLLSPIVQENVIQEEGIRKSFKPKSWTLHEPLLRSGDFIVRNNLGERLWIASTTITRWRSQPIRQLMDLELVELNHPIYKIPV